MKICTFINFPYGIYNEGSNILFFIHQDGRDVGLFQNQAL